MAEPGSITDIPDSIGPYKILSKLGQEGMGVVYEAQDLRLDRIVALKVISDFDAGPSRQRRFWQEARAAGSGRSCLLAL
jgi:serine/threonine protein kinase